MLSEHVKNVHKVNTNEVNEKTVLYMCNVCEKTFLSENALNEHSASINHNDFKCHFCSTQMQTKGELIRHIRISHGKQPVVQIDETVIYKCSSY